ncbi:MAG: c-type cytochrome [Stenotrophobium sp.]
MKGLPAAVLSALALSGTLAFTAYVIIGVIHDSETRRPYDSVLAAAASPDDRAVAPQSLTATAFQPPDESTLPDDEFGKVVRRGKAIFTRTDTVVPQFVGNHLQCQSCHLNAGRQANSAPMWAAYGLYPAYRKKNHRVNTFSERLQGCFRFSMNGKAPPPGDPVLVALETYAYWLAKGAPTGVKLEGQGFLKLDPPALAPDYARGSQAYTQHCAACHQPNGAGSPPAGAGMHVPALWGSGSYNWGAGMHRVSTAAGFIKANMPLGQGNSLSDQQAWDVALFIDSQERPQDPRYTGSVEQTRQQFHDDPDSMYGKTVNGHVLGSRASASGTLLTNHGAASP